MDFASFRIVVRAVYRPYKNSSYSSKLSFECLSYCQAWISMTFTRCNFKLHLALFKQQKHPQKKVVTNDNIFKMCPRVCLERHNSFIIKYPEAGTTYHGANPSSAT